MLVDLFMSLLTHDYSLGGHSHLILPDPLLRFWADTYLKRKGSCSRTTTGKGDAQKFTALNIFILKKVKFEFLAIAFIHRVKKVIL